MSHIEQVEHRLSKKTTAGGITIIDDAFNSNPDGSKMALDVLSQMNGGKRIVITPGMIELGEKQYELNKTFGEHIAESVDIAIVVGKYNRDAITEGINSKGFDKKIFTSLTLSLKLRQHFHRLSRQVTRYFTKMTFPTLSNNIQTIH